MYQVLYRKWRPQTFNDVVGQEHITSTLKNEVAIGKASHAYLFTGSRGTGKTTCAKILAKAVNCPNSTDGNPCNKCETCLGIDDGTVLDVIEIDAASNNGVDNIRDLREEANYTPVNAKYRVYIIDEVHMLSIGAFNALLKTLEEPPEHVKFILATTEVHKLPDTILSRCQRFDFHRITPESISSRLDYVAQNEKLQLDKGASLLIARIADGALRDALSLLDRCAGINEHITTDIVTNAAGLASKEYLFELVDAICEIDSSRVLSLIDKLHHDACDMERLCFELIHHIRNLMIIKTVKNPQTLMICTDTELERYREQANKTNLYKILYYLAELENCGALLHNSPDKRTQMELSAVKICIPNISDDNTALLARIEALENKLKSGDFTVKTNQPTANESPKENKKSEPIKESVPQAVLETISRDLFTSPIEEEKTIPTETTGDVVFTDWSRVIDELNVTDKPLTGILSSSTAFIRGDHILIKCNNPIFSQFIRQDNHALAIRKAIFNVAGRKYRLGIYTSDDKKENINDPLADLINKING